MYQERQEERKGKKTDRDHDKGSEHETDEDVRNK